MLRRLKLMMTWLVVLSVAGIFYTSLHVVVTRGVFSAASLTTQIQTITTTSSNAVTEPLLVGPTSIRGGSNGQKLPESAVLLPDWEALLLFPEDEVADMVGPVDCLFHNGITSRAHMSGTVPSTGRAAFICLLPPSVQRLRPFRSPRLVSAESPKSPVQFNRAGLDESAPEMIRWRRVVYEAVRTADDVIVLAKGVNTRPAGGPHHPAADVTCVYYSGSGDFTVSVAATSSAQEVFRCPHPPPEAVADIRGPLRVSLSIDTSLLPSLATYTGEAQDSRQGTRALVCACTMVYNIAKFLGEWVAYHAAVGVEKFFLYDNGSDDDLHSIVRQLNNQGYNVSVRFWPWPKTQEAGFSHCAAVQRNSCEWMAFIDVDEFVFEPAWSRSARPDTSLMSSLLQVKPDIGQVVIGCHEFGPSGQRVHPKDGVTQGYTCRRQNHVRHKSLVRLDAVDRSLLNSVHHFWLQDGYRSIKKGSAMVNHYKYQAWDEFKVKFRRRVSAYVVDWTSSVNPGSKDRTPGLGFEAVEPDGWDWMFCEVQDTRLRDTARTWFRVTDPGSEYRMMWAGTDPAPIRSKNLQMH